MKQFEIHSTKTDIITTLSFEGNKLCGVRFSVAPERPESFSYTAHYMPTIEAMYEKCKELKYKVVEITAYTFEEFWERYNHKVDKKRAKDQWARLKAEEQARAIAYVPEYDKELRKTGVAKMHPKTYLYNKIWEV